MRELSKTEQLLIRACKSGNKEERLRKIYRKYWICSNDRPSPRESEYIARILGRLVEDYNPIPLGKLMENLDPQNAWMYGKNENTNYWEISLCVMTSWISCTESKKFPGLTAPAWVRNRYAE